MKNIGSVLIRNRPFFYLFLSFLMLGFILLSRESKAASFFELNRIHTSFLDLIFINYTFLGDGIFSVIAVAVLLLIRKQAVAIQALISFLVSGLLIQLLKNIFQMPRPKAFFEPGQYSYFINGITHSGLNSFPSGHTTSAFALATIITLNTDDKRWGRFFFVAATVVGYSRIYLGQHFLQDVVAGAIIGVFTFVIGYFFFSTKAKSQEELQT